MEYYSAVKRNTHELMNLKSEISEIEWNKVDTKEYILDTTKRVN